MSRTVYKIDTNSVSSIDATKIDWSSVQEVKTMDAGDANPDPIYAMSYDNEDGETIRTLKIKS